MGNSRDLRRILLHPVKKHQKGPSPAATNPPSRRPLPGRPLQTLHVPPRREHVVLPDVARDLEATPLRLQLRAPLITGRVVAPNVRNHPIKVNRGSEPSKHDPLSKKGVALFVVKVVGFFCVLEGYKHRERMWGLGVLGLYCSHLYIALDIIFVVTGAMARGSLGLQLAPQAHAPYLSSSLQDFWGRRWNLMVSDSLRQTIYKPIRSIASPLIGKKSATIIGVLASFLVSGLMHEWIFYYFTTVTPSWEVTFFFILHGTCLVVELLIKAAVSDKWKLHRAVSGPLTVGFVALTAAWLFFPPLIRNKVHERVFNEYVMVGSFVKTTVLPLFRN